MVRNIKKVVFFGTHELAVPALETLTELEAVPELIVTRPQPGLTTARMERHPPPTPPHWVEKWAEERKIPLVISRRATEVELKERIAALAPDLLVVAEYGRPLPEALLETAARGALELHPSALPKLRGEHALRAALSQGMSKTGITVFLPDADPWGGPILSSEEIVLEEEETFGDLVLRIIPMAKEILAEALQKVDKSKKPKTRTQNPKAASKTPAITSRHRRAPWQLEAKEVLNRWRAHAPPGLVTSIRFQTFEIVKGMAMPWVNVPFGETGTFLGMRSGRMAVLCGGHSAFGIEEVRLDKEDESINANDAAVALGITVGDQFI